MQFHDRCAAALILGEVGTREEVLRRKPPVREWWHEEEKCRLDGGGGEQAKQAVAEVVQVVEVERERIYYWIDQITQVKVVLKFK